MMHVQLPRSRLSEVRRAADFKAESCLSFVTKVIDRMPSVRYVSTTVVSHRLDCTNPNDCKFTRTLVRHPSAQPSACLHHVIRTQKSTRSCRSHRPFGRLVARAISTRSMSVSTLLKTLVGYFLSVDDHPRLLIVQQYQFSHPIPANGPVFTGNS